MYLCAAVFYDVRVSYQFVMNSPHIPNLGSDLGIVVKVPYECW